LDFRLPAVCRIHPDGEESEAGAKDIFAFGNPGNGFNVDGVQSEEGGNKGAAPVRAGHLLEQAKEQQRVEGVEKKIGGMVSGGVEAVELAIEHVGEPGQRMPVAGVAGGKSPTPALQAETALDHEVLSHIVRVVEVKELAVADLPVGAYGGDREQNAEDY
jgi:hypothetical protein